MAESVGSLVSVELEPSYDEPGTIYHVRFQVDWSIGARGTELTLPAVIVLGSNGIEAATVEAQKKLADHFGVLAEAFRSSIPPDEQKSGLSATTE